MRHARPQGATFLALTFQKLGSEEAKQNVYKHLITLYTLNGFRYNNQQVSIPKLSQMLQIPTSDIMAQISNLGSNLGSLATPENIENTLKSIITLSTTWAIQDRGLISHQVEQLLDSQGNKYKPFISGEVNKALKLLLESNKNLMESYKTFFSAPATTNILNIYGKNEQKGELVTPDQALTLIHENIKALPNHQSTSVPTLADKLYEDYRIGEKIDVRENRTGIKALVAPDPEGLQATIYDAKGVTKPQGPKATHGKHRNEFEIDLDQLPSSD